ncbi:MAG: DUF3237 domain-containing protein [Gammaproteobacteria bacterium]
MSTSLGRDLPEALTNLRTTPLFVMRLDVRPMQIFASQPGGYRRVGVVFGGSFEGERLSGTVLDGGSDWQTVRSDGTAILDVRLILKTQDDTLIGMTYRGVRHGPPDVLARIDHGEVMDPATHYFRIAPMFETAAPRYDWLSRIVAVGIGHRRADGPVYSVFEVL